MISVLVAVCTSIWIVSEPRPEHARAISWLNDTSPADFHLFRVEAVKIGDSEPAPLLSAIVGPSPDSVGIAQKRRESKVRNRGEYDFWTILLGIARDRTKLFSGISPSKGPYIQTTSGTPGINYEFLLRKDNVYVQAWIDRGKDCDEQNQAMFEELLSHREDIEAAYGGTLDWNPISGARACKITGGSVDGGWNSDAEVWPETATKVVEEMIRFTDALSPYVAQLKSH